jgi:hypothetical protein
MYLAQKNWKNHFKITYLTKSHMIITDIFPNHALLELDYYEITEILWNREKK